MHGRRQSEPPDLQAALEAALGYLAARPRTRCELERRLRRSGAGELVVTAALERLAELGYVDDLAFARWWTEQRDRHAPRGRRLIAAELRQKGVPREIIEEMHDELLDRSAGDAPLPETDAERASVALDRHLRGRPMPPDAMAVRRLGMFLMRRGFDAETARGAIRERASREPPDE